MSRPPFEVADIIRISGDSFRQRYSASLTRSTSSLTGPSKLPNKCSGLYLTVPGKSHVRKADIQSSDNSWTNHRVIRSRLRIESLSFTGYAATSLSAFRFWIWVAPVQTLHRH
jgi:hypothetical protein